MNDDQLARIEARLERIERALDVAKDVPNAVAIATDTIDDWARKHPDLDERLEAFLAVFEHLTRPKTLKGLKLVLDHLENLPNTIAIAGDTLDDIARQAAAQGLPVGTLFEDLSGTLAAFIRVAPKLRATLESGMLDARAIETLGRMAKTASDLTEHEPTPVGFFGAIKAMSDPEVQRSVGFAVEMAKGFGRINSTAPVPSIPATTTAQSPNGASK